MKLANIEDGLKPGTLRKYIEKYDYHLIEVYDEAEEFVDVTSMLNKCLITARDKGAVEFYVKEIRNRYIINEDTHLWTVRVVGFVPNK